MGSAVTYEFLGSGIRRRAYCSRHVRFLGSSKPHPFGNYPPEMLSDVLIGGTRY